MLWRREVGWRAFLFRCVLEEGGDGGGSGRGASAKVRYLSRKGFGWLGVFESEGGPGTVVDRGS